VSKPTIYRRWPEGKDELIAAAVCGRHQEFAVETDTGSLRGDLLAVVGQKVATMKENAQLAAGLSSRLRESPELASVVRDQILAAERVRFVAIVDRAVARGELRARPAALELITDVAPSLAHGRLLILGEELDESFATEVVDHILLPALRMSAHPDHPEPDKNT
jgi:AcrR family transcriptional regulator